MMKKLLNGIGYGSIGLLALVLLPFIWPGAVGLTLARLAHDRYGLDEMPIAGIVALTLVIQSVYLIWFGQWLNQVGG